MQNPIRTIGNLLFLVNSNLSVVCTSSSLKTASRGLVLLLGNDDLGGLVLHLQDGPAAGVGVLLHGYGVRGLPGPRRRLRIGV